MTHTSYAPLFNELIEWIEHHIGDDLTLDEVALKSGYTKWHLQRLFKMHVGLSLATYIRRRRLTIIYEAVLKNIHAGIDEKRRFCELPEFHFFHDHPTLCRAFKKQFGFPPRRVGIELPPESSFQHKVHLS